MSPVPPLVAVDIGNQRLKFGLFSQSQEFLPTPTQTLAMTANEGFDALDSWIGPRTNLSWWIGSVNRPSATVAIEWLRRHRPGEAITLLAAGDLPLKAAVERPDMVGIDRLLDALAVNRLRSPDRAAIVVDIGSAITVDLVSADGVFQGGAILPGIAMSARALHTFTDLLPLIDTADLDEPPPPVGKATVAAMQAGLYWGAVGAIRELASQFAEGRPADLVVTGGAGPAVAGLLGPAARHVPHLTLAGIALAAIAAQPTLP